MNIMKIDHITKKYGRKTALQNVSFALEEGKLYALCGNNGAGKSTLLRILCNIDRVNEGSVQYKNEPIHYLHKNEIAYFADESFFTEDTKIYEIFELYSHFFQDFDVQKCEQLVYKNGITPDTLLSSLSKGTRVKLELTFPLCRKAKVYLFDEPFANLDPLVREEVMRMIVNCGNENATYVISTHIISDFETYFDQVLFLHDGELIVDQSVDEIFEERHMSIQDYLKECLRTFER